MNHLRKASFLILLGCTILSTNLLAQEDGTKKNNSKSILNNFSVTPQVGLLHYWGDLSHKGKLESLFDADENNLGYGGLINYHLTDYLSISGGILAGRISGTDLTIDTKNASSQTADYGIGIEHRTDMYEITLPRVDVNLTRLIFKDEVKFFRKFSINAFLSHGLINFNSKVYALNQDDVSVKYYPDRGRTGETNEAVSTYGSSISYIINPRFDIGLESSIRNVYNDKLDAWPSDGSANDKYSFTALSVTYHLKPRKNVTKDFNLQDEIVKEESEPKEQKPEVKKVTEEKKKELEESQDDENTIFGVFRYKNLPADSVALVILDENGNPIDTVYTDGEGKFKYQRLNRDEQIAIVPLNMENMEVDDIEMYLTDGEEGNKTDELDFSDNRESFIIGGKRKQEPVAKEPEAKPVKEVKTEPKEEKKEVKTKTEEKVGGLELYEGSGNFVSVAAFREFDRAQVKAKQLMDAGETPIIVENRIGTWYIVAIDRYDTLEEALPVMKKARAEGYTRSWVLVKPAK